MSSPAQIIELGQSSSDKKQRVAEAAQIVEDLAYELAGNMRPDQTGQLITFARELMILSRELHQHH